MMNHGAHSPNGQRPHTTALTSSLPNVPGLGGAIAGLGGGAAMIVVAAMLSVATGQDMWREPREIAAPFFGGVANGVAAVLLGTLLHFLTSGLLGAVFGILSRRVLRLPTDYGVPVLGGMLYGLLIWALAYFVVVPALNPALLDTYAPSFVIQHLVYGMVTGLLYSQLRPAPYNSISTDSSWEAVPNRV